MPIPQLHEIQSLLWSLPNDIRIMGEAYAVAKANYEQLSELKSVVKHGLMVKISRMYKGQKMAEWKVRAMAETYTAEGQEKSEYQKHIEAVRIAQEESLAAQARYIALKAKMDAIRSLGALEKSLTTMS